MRKRRERQRARTLASCNLLSDMVAICAIVLFEEMEVLVRNTATICCAYLCARLLLGLSVSLNSSIKEAISSGRRNKRRLLMNIYPDNPTTLVYFPVYRVRGPVLNQSLVKKCLSLLKKIFANSQCRLFRRYCSIDLFRFSNR